MALPTRGLRVRPIQLTPKMRVQFNQFIIKKNWSKINKTPITHAGLLVRKIMRGSIRHVTSNKPSPPGRPPRSRAKGRQFKMIYSVPNPAYTRVIVGHRGFGSSQTPMEIHEFGQRAERKIFIKRRRARSDKQRRAARKLFKEGKIKSNRKRRYVIKTVQYPERKFALPALERAKTRLPRLWKNSIRRSGVRGSV